MRLVPLVALLVSVAGCAANRPRDPVPAYAGTPLRVPYYCERAPGIAVTFREADVVVERRGAAPLSLPRRASPSGFWYYRPGFELRGRGYEAYWSEGRAQPIRCQAYRPRRR